MISDTAKKVDVETHVLRYWEEELELSIGRTELGHRFYTEEDIQVFRNIKKLKARGIQLKAIKLLLPELRKKESKNLDHIIDLKEKLEQRNTETQGHDIENKAVKEKRDGKTDDIVKELGDKKESHFEIALKEAEAMVNVENNHDKLHQFELIVQNIVRQTLQENNKELENRIGDMVVREFDSRMLRQEEREEERYRKLDETIRFHQKKRHLVAAAKDGGMKRKRKRFGLF